MKEKAGDLNIMTRFPKKPVKAVNIETGAEISFESLYQASKFLNVDRNNVLKVLNGKRKKVGKFTFIR
ncbi:MAG: hypothetical protein ACQEWW_07755 [Bacillota bacterium]